MARLVFRDFDEYADSIKGVAGRFVPTARVSSEWWIEASSAGALGLQQIQIGSAATFAGDGEPGCVTLGLPMTEPRHIRIDGHWLEPDAFIFLRERQPFTFTGQDIVRWTGVTIPAETSLIAPEVLQAMQRGNGPRARTQSIYLDRLRWLVSRACSAGDGIDLSDPASAASAEQEIALYTAHALERSMRVEDRHVGRPQFCRARVIARTLALIDANEGQPLFIEDLCRATQVSERTLRNIFHEFFGVGPMRLLKMRQLREIRAALMRADPARDTVTRIAARFGIWDFSLFARNYKALFGESPSRTLRLASGDARQRPVLSWLHYAVRTFVDEPSPAADAAASSSEAEHTPEAQVAAAREE